MDLRPSLWFCFRVGDFSMPCACGLVRVCVCAAILHPPPTNTQRLPKERVKERYYTGEEDKRPSTHFLFEEKGGNQKGRCLDATSSRAGMSQVF